MGDMRALTDGEIEMLSSIYGDAIGYSSVRVRNGGTALGVGYAPFNTINIGGDIYRSDYSSEPNLNLQDFCARK